MASKWLQYHASWCCILENYQTPEGVVVPEILRPFMCGLEFIPFKKNYLTAEADTAKDANMARGNESFMVG